MTIRATPGELEKAPLPDVIKSLGVQLDSGLTAEEASARLGTYGPNAIAEKDRSLCVRRWATSPAPSRT